MSRLTTYAFLVLLLLSSAWAERALAFTTSVCTKCCWPYDCTATTLKWPGSSTTFQVHTNFGSGATSCTRDAGTTALNDTFCASQGWFDVYSSSWFFNVNGNQSFSTFPSGDDINQVGFVASSNFDAGVVAKTPIQWDCDCGWSVKITESDMLFNSATSWFIGLPTPWTLNGTALVSLRIVAMHEMGHALGLGITNHQDGFPTLMNTNYPDGGWAHGATGFGSMTPHADDRAGDVALYSNGQSDLTDLEVRPYCWDGTNNFARQALTNQQNPANVNDATSNCAVRGVDTVFVRSTFENLKNTAFTNIRIGFYLSTDTVITTADTLIATTTWSPASYEHINPTYNVFIPSWVGVGTYSFGVIVDDTDVVQSEVNNANNATNYINQLEVKTSCP